MSEEEYMECSVVAYPRQIKFLHINGGAISYYVDRHVSDYVDRLQKENQELKLELSGYRQAILEDKDMLGLKEENQSLKKQLEYLRSGEYYNQLRFENEMLQQVVDTNGVPSEVYDYIDCTHRNTELLEQNQKYKEVIDKINKYINDYNVFEVFSFPLMKRWEEEQVKSSIDYEFKTSLIKDLKDILKEVE